MDIQSYWPIIDTSVKVGLGALIAGGMAWLATRSQTSQVASAKHQRRIDLLEGISSDVGNVNHVFAKYSSLVIESTRFGNRWPDARRDELERVNRELVVEFKKLADAEAKLLMLGEKAMEKTLRLYGAKIALFRKEVYMGRKDISDNDIAKYKADINGYREQFYDILSRKYDRLLAT